MNIITSYSFIRLMRNKLTKKSYAPKTRLTTNREEEHPVICIRYWTNDHRICVSRWLVSSIFGQIYQRKSRKKTGILGEWNDNPDVDAWVLSLSEWNAVHWVPMDELSGQVREAAGSEPVQSRCPVAATDSWTTAALLANQTRCPATFLLSW